MPADRAGPLGVWPCCHSPPHARAAAELCSSARPPPRSIYNARSSSARPRVHLASLFRARVTRDTCARARASCRARVTREAVWPGWLPARRAYKGNAQRTSRRVSLVPRVSRRCASRARREGSRARQTPRYPIPAPIWRFSGPDDSPLRPGISKFFAGNVDETPEKPLPLCYRFPATGAGGSGPALGSARRVGSRLAPPASRSDKGRGNAPGSTDRSADEVTGRPVRVGQLAGPQGGAKALRLAGAQKAPSPRERTNFRAWTRSRRLAT